MSRQRASLTSSGVVVALTYVRVSTEDQATNGTSLDAQTREVRRYVAERGWVLGQEFSDVLSGKRTDRPAYQALLRRVRELRTDGQPVVVVVAALDRFGRRVLERVRSREELKALGVETHSVREGGLVSDLVANVLASVAQEEVDRIGMRVAAAWRNLAGQGWFKISGQLPWGYTSRPATAEERQAGSPRSVLVPDAVSAPYVVELFRRVAAGESVRSVSTWAALLPEDVRGAWQCGRGSTPRRELKRDAIGKILRNDVYVAPEPARWPAVIDMETWNKVQRRLDANREAPRAQPAVYRLTGFIRCGACGQRMSGEMAGSYKRYRCSAWRRGGASVPFCSASCGAEQVERLVLDALSERIAAFVATDRRRLERAWARLAEREHDASATREIRRLEQQVETARRRITDATRLLLDGAIDKEAYDGLVAAERGALDAASAELAHWQEVEQSGPTLPPLGMVLADLDSWADALQQADLGAFREALDALVEHVVPMRVKHGVYRVEVVWSDLGSHLAQAADAAVRRPT